MKKLSGMTKASLGLAALFVGMGGLKMYEFRREDERWSQRQRAEILSAMSTLTSDQNYRRAQELLYDTTNQNHVPQDAVGLIKETLSIPASQAAELAAAQRELYRFMKANYGSNVTYERLNNKTLIGELEEKTQKITTLIESASPALKSSLRNELAEATQTFALDGYRDRQYPPLTIEGRTVERTAYNVLRDANQRPFTILGKTISVPHEVHWESAVSAMDINKDNIITAQEAVNWYFSGLNTP